MREEKDEGCSTTMDRARRDENVNRSKSLSDFFPSSKLIRLLGYARGNKDYQKAKTPVDKWKGVPGLTQQEKVDWISQGGWLGLVISGGNVLIDVDNREVGEGLFDAMERNNFRFIGIKTPRGFQFFFKGTGRVKNQTAKMLTVGRQIVDYRLPGNGYIVLPTENTENRKVIHWPEGGELDPMPLIFMPARRARPDDVPLAIPIQKGARNDTLFRDCVCSLRSLNAQHNLGLTFNDQVAVVKEINALFCLPPLSQQEVESICNSAERYEETPSTARIIPISGKGDLGDKGDFVSLNDYDILTPVPYPLDIFPYGYKNVIEQISKSYHVEEAVVASVMNAIVSGAIGNSLRFSPRDSWDVIPFLWQMIIAETGYGKSPFMSFLMQPVQKRQAVEYNNYLKNQKEYERALRLMKQDPSMVLPDQPRMRHYLISDFTIEGMARIFKEDPRGCINYRDEIAALISGLNQYRQGKGNDRQQILQLFDGDPWKIDRKSSVLYIPNTGCSMIGGIQTRILPEIFGSNSFDDGLIPRFLITIGKMIKPTFCRQGLGPEVIGYWESILAFCFAIPLMQNEDGLNIPLVLQFNDWALAVLENFHNTIYNLAPFLSRKAQVFVPKFITYAIKLAGVLHILRAFPNQHEINTPINAEEVSDACRLIAFHSGQVMQALKLYGKPDKEYKQYHVLLVEVLDFLRNEMKEGLLSLEDIKQELNKRLPDKVKIEHNKRIGGLLRELGLETTQSTGGLYFLVWNEDHIQKLLLETKSTTSTLSTQEAVPNRQVTNPHPDICADNIVPLRKSADSEIVDDEGDLLTEEQSSKGGVA